MSVPRRKSIQRLDFPSAKRSANKTIDRNMSHTHIIDRNKCVERKICFDTCTDTTASNLKHLRAENQKHNY